VRSLRIQMSEYQHLPLLPRDGLRVTQDREEGGEGEMMG
jgi:hypothetical protein